MAGGTSDSKVADACKRGEDCVEWSQGKSRKFLCVDILAVFSSLAFFCCKVMMLRNESKIS